jgi:hypothetical protein
MTDKSRIKILIVDDEQFMLRLVALSLGIKGTLSVVELKVIRQRLQAGQESKARRGELFKRLPIGYERNATGKVVFHPDRRVYEAIQLVFTKFRELWSVRQTFQWFRDHDVDLPANPIQGAGLVCLRWNFFLSLGNYHNSQARWLLLSSCSDDETF